MKALTEDGAAQTDRDYESFLEAKRAVAPAVGKDVRPSRINPALFPFQRDLTRWALRKGRAAIFATTGAGKTFMQLEWARLSGERALILAPLAVAQQTVHEAEKLGTKVVYAREQSDAGKITTTNYEMLEHFDPAEFGAVVLDESSILKAYDGKMRTRLIETFQGVPFRLCCTATPAPNDIAEIANHAEFLGVMTRVEMLASFFVHDDAGWRLKRHARIPFYRWLASWGMTLMRPSDLGYEDDGFVLPPLNIELDSVASDYVPDGRLFHAGLSGITDRSKVRQGTLEDRVAHAAKLISAEPDEPWIAWVGLNEEGRALADLIIPDAVLIEGSQSIDVKQRGIEAFLSGEARVLISKPRISGFGLNLQHCARMVFVGLSDSWEQYFQCIRRCWRFGQSRPVDAHIVLSDVERPIYDNVLRKEQEAEAMAKELAKNVAEFERKEIASRSAEEFTYAEDEAKGEGWTLRLGDSIERIREVPDDSIDLSVFSPPFASLYTYSATERDLGNSLSSEQFWEHFGFLIRELLRVVKPGRNVCVHVMNLATTLANHGVIGLSDFRGDTIRAFQDGGFIYHGEICIDKNPQAQAIRTHAKGLLFVQKNKDASWLRPALADYILVFRVPGENAAPVRSDLTNEEWIEWARPVWYGIRETDTLNVQEARAPEDERHIAPLQLPTIERVVRLWSNPGELVFSPFAGIGSEGFESLKRGRRFLGIELKDSYFRIAVRNLQRAEAEKDAPDLLALLEAE